jgi:adenylate kinase family enzyme
MSSSGKDSGDALSADARRIVVTGSTGSGKTTLARQLSQLLGIPHVELDAFNWEPNWTQATTEVFKQRVAEALRGDNWVVDGNYSAVRDLVWPRAALLVWLDFPLRVIMWRLFWRTLLRGIKKEELWNGNREQLRTNFLSRDSLFIWVLKTYWRRRREYPDLLKQPEYAHLKVVRLRSSKEMRRWLRRFAFSKEEAT